MIDRCSTPQEAIVAILFSRPNGGYVDAAKSAELICHELSEYWKKHPDPDFIRTLNERTSTMHPKERRSETLDSIVSWQLATFPGVKPEAAADRLLKELEEFRAAPGPKEASDCLIVACQLFASIAAVDPQHWVNSTMKENRERKWEIAKDGTGQHK